MGAELFGGGAEVCGPLWPGDFGDDHERREGVAGPVVDLVDQITPLVVDNIAVGEGRAGADGLLEGLAFPQAAVGLLELVKLVDQCCGVDHAVPLIDVAFVVPGVAVGVVIQQVVAGLAVVQELLQDFVGEVANRIGGIVGGFPQVVCRFGRHVACSGCGRPRCEPIGTARR